MELNKAISKLKDDYINQIICFSGLYNITAIARPVVTRVVDDIFMRKNDNDLFESLEKDYDIEILHKLFMQDFNINTDNNVIITHVVKPSIRNIIETARKHIVCVYFGDI